VWAYANRAARRGRFARLWRDEGRPNPLTSSELALFLEGCTLVARQSLSPAELMLVPPIAAPLRYAL
jgi:hypothetical protein